MNRDKVVRIIWSGLRSPQHPTRLALRIEAELFRVYGPVGAAAEAAAAERDGIPSELYAQRVHQLYERLSPPGNPDWRMAPLLLSGA